MLFFSKEVLISWGPAFLNLIVSGLLIYLTHKYMNRQNRKDPERAWIRQILLGILIFILVSGVIVSFPISGKARELVFTILGTAITAVFAFSSTSLVGNTMASLALKLIGGIRPGDFITVGEHTGRISEQGLLHTEIQTEERRLTTIPNLYLITTPHTVVRSTGTVVSASLSLGYDVSRYKIEKCLLEAAEKTELKDSYVHILELGDFSVTYRVAGFLDKVKFLISVKSKLLGNVLDVLHENDIEIVSPSFMNQRALDPKAAVIAKVNNIEKLEAQNVGINPEDLIFDKAEVAESKEEIKHMCNRVRTRIAETEEKLKEPEISEEEKTKLLGRIEHLKKRDAKLNEMLTQLDQ